MDWFRETWFKDMAELRSGDRFKSMYLGNWAMNDAVHMREDVAAMLQRGEISENRAQEMLWMCYEVNRKGEKVVASKEPR